MNKMNEELKLTPRQELFVEFYQQTGNATKAAEMAGYAGDQNTLSTIGYENLRKPNVIRALELKKNDLRTRFEQESINAFNVMVSIINDPRVSARTKLDACKDILDRAGYKPSDKVELTGKGGSPVLYETRLTKEIVSRARSLVNLESEILPAIDVDSSA